MHIACRDRFNRFLSAFNPRLFAGELRDSPLTFAIAVKAGAVTKGETSTSNVPGTYRHVSASARGPLPHVFSVRRF